jgi:hypothetical protein
MLPSGLLGVSLLEVDQKAIHLPSLLTAGWLLTPKLALVTLIVLDESPTAAMELARGTAWPLYGSGRIVAMSGEEVAGSNSYDRALWEMGTILVVVWAVTICRPGGGASVPVVIAVAALAVVLVNDFIMRGK